MPQAGEIKTWLETKYGKPIIFDGICTIGRAETNNLIVSKTAVSRHHAIIHEREGDYWIVDLGGLNGTRVNGERVAQSSRLKSGDLIQIPLMDFVFRQETVPVEELAAAESDPPLLQEPSPEGKPKPEPSSPEVTIASTTTVPLPGPVKPTQQDELPFRLSSEPLDETDKSPRPRVDIGPVKADGSPELPSRPTRPAALKPLETFTVASAVQLPKQTDALLKVTTPLSLSPPIEKPAEVIQINAPDVIVPGPEKPKVPPPSLHQFASLKEAVSATKSVALLEKFKESAPISSPRAVPASQPINAPPPLPKAAPQPAETNASAGPRSDGSNLSPPHPKGPAPASVIDPLTASAKLDKTNDSPSIDPLQAMPVSSGPAVPKPAVKKSGTPTRKEVRPTSEVIPPTDSSTIDGPAPQSVLCPSAMHSMYIGLASIFLPFVGLLIAPIAIILGHSALNKINQSRGAVTGRQSAVLGLYFGYISLSLISAYSILIYLLFFAPGQSKGTAFPAGPPPLLVLTTPSLPATTETTINPVPASGLPAPAPSIANPTVAPHIAPDLQPSMPSPPVPPVPSPAPDVTTGSQPEAVPSPAPPVALPAKAPVPQTITHEGTGTSAPASPPALDNPTAKVDTALPPSAVHATAASSLPPAPARPPVVYDLVLLKRLKDGMLLQPMPEDTSSRLTRMMKVLIFVRTSLRALPMPGMPSRFMTSLRT